MTFSPWHLLGLIPVAIGFVAVALTRGHRVIGRLAFLVRLFGLVTFGIALSFVLRRRDEGVAALIMLLYLMAGCYLIPYWATSRLRDMGVRQKYWAVLTDVPIIGWLYTIYLVCAKPTNDLLKDDDDLPPIVAQEVVDEIEAERARGAEGKLAS